MTGHAATSIPRLRRLALGAPAILPLLWLAWVLLDWAVLRAVFRPDAQACQALAHSGACWGVIAAKWSTLLTGHDPNWSWTSPATWAGLPLTLFVAVCSYVLAWPIGIALAMARHARRPWLSWPAAALIETIRGVPLVIWLFVAAFLLPRVLPQPDSLSLATRVLITLAVFAGAYMAEVLRGGLQTVQPSQTEAAAILGLSWWGTQWRVVWPQALRTVTPALTGHAIGLFKDTSLVTVVGLHELTGGLSLSLGGDPVWRPFYFEAYLFVGLIYGLLCWGLSMLGRRIERRWPPVTG